MSLNTLPAAQALLSKPNVLLADLVELQGRRVSSVAGVTAGTKMNIAAMREGDTILAALLQGGVTTSGVSEVQHITVSATGGHFKITWNTQQTASILATANAAAVQAALEALSNIAPGDVVVTGGPGDAGGTTPYVLTWNPYLGNVAEPTCQDVDMTGTATAVPATITAGVQQVGGLFTDDAPNITIQSTHASGTLTITGDPTAAETVTVNGHAYTWRAAPTKIDEVKITSGDVTVMATALKNAINAYEGRYEPQLHGDGWRVPAVVATSNAGVVTVTSVADGAGSGPIVSNSANATVSSTDPGAVTATCASMVNTNTVTVNGVVFTAKTTPVNLDVDMAVKDTDVKQATELARIVNVYEQKYGTLGVVASQAATPTAVVTFASRYGRTGNSIKLSEASTNVAASGAGYLAGGTATGGIKSTTDLTGESLVVHWVSKTNA